MDIFVFLAVLSSAVATSNKICTPHFSDCSAQGFEHEGSVYQGNITSVYSDDYVSHQRVSDFVGSQLCRDGYWQTDFRFTDLQVLRGDPSSVLANVQGFLRGYDGGMMGTLLARDYSSNPLGPFINRYVLWESAAALETPEFLRFIGVHIMSDSNPRVPRFFPGERIITSFYTALVQMLATHSQVKMVRPGIQSMIMQARNQYYNESYSLPIDFRYDCEGGHMLLLVDDRIDYGQGDQRPVSSTCARYTLRVFEGSAHGIIDYGLLPNMGSGTIGNNQNGFQLAGTDVPLVDVPFHSSNGLCFTGPPVKALHVLPGFAKRASIQLGQHATDVSCDCSEEDMLVKKSCVYQLSAPTTIDLDRVAFVSNMAARAACEVYHNCYYHTDFPEPGYFSTTHPVQYPSDGTSVGGYLDNSRKIQQWLVDKAVECGCVYANASSSEHYSWRAVTNVTYPNFSDKMASQPHCGDTLAGAAYEAEFHMPPFGVRSPLCNMRKILEWEVKSEVCFVICFGEKKDDGVRKEDFDKLQTEVRSSFDQVNDRLEAETTFDNNVLRTLSSSADVTNRFMQATNRNFNITKREVEKIRKRVNLMSDAQYNNSIQIAKNKLQLQILTKTHNMDMANLDAQNPSGYPIKDGCIILEPSDHLDADWHEFVVESVVPTIGHPDFTAPTGTAKPPAWIKTRESASTAITWWQWILICAAVIAFLVVAFCVVKHCINSRNAKKRPVRSNEKPSKF